MLASALPSHTGDEFADLPPLAQWTLLESAFRALRVPEPTKLVPIVFIMTAQVITGQLWCLVWLLAALSGVALGTRAAQAFDKRASDASTQVWLRRYARAVWWQAAGLGAGGFGAAWDPSPVTILLLACPLGFAVTEVCASALLRRAVRVQVLLLTVPLVATCLLHGALAPRALIFVVFAGLFVLWAWGAMHMAGQAAARLRLLTLAMTEIAHAPALPGRHPVLPPAAADFQKLLGRDQVTGLPNRHSFAHLLAQESDRASRAEAPLSLLLIAWDEFEEVSTRGTPHLLDASLSDIAKRLRGALRRRSDLLASLGGGRYGVLLPATDAFGATIVARNLQAALGHAADAAPGTVETKPPPVPVSIGAATYCGKGMLPEAELLEYAEEALRDARTTGGNRIRRYDPALKALHAPGTKPPPRKDATPHVEKREDAHS